MKKRSLFGAALLSAALSLPATAQTQRVVLNGVETNLHVDWVGTSAVVDPLNPQAFLILMPLELLTSWSRFESKTSMDFNYGPGNWLRCRMTATDWGYLSGDPCAHLPGSNAGFPYPLPLSLLTSTYDAGAYLGSVGAPHFPIPDFTLFDQTPVSFVQGLDNDWSFESWQLRTRGFWPNDLWNGCAPSVDVTPNFSGWLVARFEFSFF